MQRSWLGVVLDPAANAAGGASSDKRAITIDSDPHHPLTGLTATGLSRVSSMSSLS